MHLPRLKRFISISIVITLTLLVFKITNCSAFGHKWKAMAITFRYFQERMLRSSENRAQLNYGIVFECRTT